MEKKRSLAVEAKIPKGKHCPNWLQLVTGEDGRKQYVAIPERAELLVRIFELAAGGLGKRSIAKILNEEKIKPWRKGKGKGWAESTLHFLLKWPAAMGVYQPCRLDPETRRRIPEGPAIEGYYPQVVSNELWQRAQCRTQAPRGPRRPGTRNLFTGLVIDGNNGCKMHYNEKSAAGRSRSYLCTARIRPDGIKSQMWPYDHFERIVLDHLRELDWSLLINKGPDQEVGKLNSQIADSEVRIKTLSTEIEKFLTTLTDMPEALLKIAMAEAAAKAEKKEELQSGLDAMRQLRDRLTATRDSMTAGVEEFKALIAMGDPQSRLALQTEIRRRIKSITLRVEKMAKGKQAKIAICYVNGACTWFRFSTIGANAFNSKAIEFEAPGKGRHTFQESYSINRNTDEEEHDQYPPFIDEEASSTQ